MYLKALHIIFVVTWFAGLFYLVRLFVYHAEAHEMQEPERSALIRHFKGAQRRLWYGITVPSAILTWILGCWIGYSYYGFDLPVWLLIKFAFVLGLTLYHLWCGHVIGRLRSDHIDWSGTAFRIWNEVATIFLVAIVFIVVLKDSMEWVKGLAGFVVFAALLFLAVGIYKAVRERSR